MVTKILTQAALTHFVLYFVIGMAMIWAFTQLYVKMTPHDEFKEIKSGKLGSAIMLSGATLGFAMPLLSASMHSASLVEYVIWGAIAGVIQMVWFWVYYLANKEAWRAAHEDNLAEAIRFAVISIVVGLFNAFSLVP